MKKRLQKYSLDYAVDTYSRIGRVMGSTASDDRQAQMSEENGSAPSNPRPMTRRNMWNCSTLPSMTSSI